MYQKLNNQIYVKKKYIKYFPTNTNCLYYILCQDWEILEDLLSKECLCTKNLKEHDMFGHRKVNNHYYFQEQGLFYITVNFAIVRNINFFICILVSFFLTTFVKTI